MLSAAARVNPKASQANQVSEDRRAKLRERIRELRAGLQEKRVKKPLKHSEVCVDCGEQHPTSTKQRNKSSTENPMLSPPALNRATKPIPPSVPLPAPTYSQPKDEILWRVPPSPPTPTLPDDVPDLQEEDEEGENGSVASTVILSSSSDEEEEEEPLVTEPSPDQKPAFADNANRLRFDEIAEDVVEFQGTFEEYLVDLAKSSDDDLNACRRVREYLRCIPSSEFTCNRDGGRDDVTVTDRGLRLLCVLINTPKSLALWNKAARFIEDPDTKGDLSTVFAGLPIAGSPPSTPDGDEAWSKKDFDSVEDMVDVVEDAWKVASLGGYSSQQEFEEEQRFIQEIRSRLAPTVRTKMNPDAFEKLRVQIGQQLKRKQSPSPSTYSSSDPDQKSSDSVESASTKKRKNKKRRNKKNRSNNKTDA